MFFFNSLAGNRNRPQRVITNHINTMTHEEKKLVEDIREAAMQDYDNGGHWVAECYTEEDILNHFDSVQDAKEAWRLKEENEQEKEAAREFYNDGAFWAELYGVEQS